MHSKSVAGLNSLSSETRLLLGNWHSWPFFPLDYFVIPDEEIKQLESMLTVVRGTIRPDEVWARKGIDYSKTVVALSSNQNKTGPDFFKI
jgi:hypothetical protein